MRRPVVASTTIDGVFISRQLAERLTKAWYETEARNELRALLDAQAVEADPIVAVLKGHLASGKQPTFSGGDLKHLIGLLERVPADDALEHLRCDGQAGVRRKGSRKPCGCLV